MSCFCFYYILFTNFARKFYWGHSLTVYGIK